MAQIDSSIALGFRPTTQIEQPVNTLARLLQAQGLQQKNQLGQMKMDEYRSGVERKNKLASLLSGQYDTDAAREDAVLRGGFIDEAQQLRKGRIDAAKGATDAEQSKLKLAMEKVGFVGQLLGGVKDQASYDQARAIGQQNGLDVSQMPPQYDPALVEQKRAQALSYAQQLEQEWKKKDFGHKERTQSEVERNNRVQNSISQQNANTSAGQLGLSRERLAFDQGNAVSDAGGPSQAGLTKRFGKAPPGYRWKEDGSAEAVPGGPADIKAGEAGAKAQARKDAAALAAGNVLSAVKDAKNLVGPTTAGAGSVLSRVPGLNARDLQAKLDTVKANLGFDRLQQMREMSPTGGALGAVAVQELIALQSTVASLDQAQSPKELRKSLEKIEQHYNKWLGAVNESAGGASNPAPAQGGFKIISVE